LDLMERDAASSTRHPWEISRSDFFARLLSDAGVFQPGLRLLDAGAGDGYVARRWMASNQELDSVTCWDAAYTDDDLRALATHPDQRIAFIRDAPRSKFRLVVLLDVLEHVEDDTGFLNSVVENYAEDGATVLISVPAWPSLFSNHDVFIQHYRRYRPRQARELIRGAGLSIVNEGGLFHGPLLARSAQKAVAPLLPAPESQGVGAWNKSAWLTRATLQAFRADNSVSRFLASRGIGLPGLSWWARCIKNAQPAPRRTNPALSTDPASSDGL